MDCEFEIIETLERELASKEIRQDLTRMETLFHNEFSEIGKSGRIFNKKDILVEVPSWEYFDTTLSDFTFRELSKNVIMLKYESSVGGINAHRTSIWVKENSNWQILHHQGTICS